MEATEAKGPVNVHGEMDIAASDRDVWAVLADIEGWPSWNPAIRDAVVDGALEMATHFRFATGPGTMSCRLLQVDAPGSLAWSGRQMGVGHRQSWRIEPRPEGCLVTIDGSMSGPVARLFKGRLRRQAQRDLDAWLRLLKLEAESRASAYREEGEGSGT